MGTSIPLFDSYPYFVIRKNLNLNPVNVSFPCQTLGRFEWVFVGTG